MLYQTIDSIGPLDAGAMAAAETHQGRLAIIP
jgi:hypothetical protein